jgi:alanyl-tRNA synthetase
MRLGATEFLGYETENAEGEVLAIVKDGEGVPSAGAGDSVAIVVNQTPFYAESGGQVADTGVIVGERAAPSSRTCRSAPTASMRHYARIEKGTLAVGDAVQLAVEGVRRTAIRGNHSATHLLHAALRNVLGSHVAQKGSLVAPDRLRFDFSHPKPMEAHEIEAVEDLANRVLLQDAPVVTHLMDREEAMASGAMALFGEKYGEEVRVVSMGTMPGGVPDKVYSVELCGGTHVGRTGEIGLVTLVGEAGVAAGVRRIEALTGEAARKHLSRAGEAPPCRRHGPEGAPRRGGRACRRAGRGAAEARARALRREAQARHGRRRVWRWSGADIRTVGSVKFLGRSVNGISPKDLKGLADDGKKAVGSGVVAIVGVSDDGKGAIVVGVTDDLTDKFSAVDLVRKGAEALGGKGGGGRPDMAQAGGPDGAKADAALAAIEAALAS